MTQSVAVASSLALKGVLEHFRARFEKALGARLDLRFDATQALLSQLAGGLRADLLILAAEALEDLAQAGKVAQGRELGSSGVGVAVRAGAPRPAIGTPEAFRRSLESAGSVAHSKVGASGIYFAGLLERERI